MTRTLAASDVTEKRKARPDIQLTTWGPMRVIESRPPGGPLGYIGLLPLGVRGPSFAITHTLLREFPTSLLHPTYFSRSQKLPLSFPNQLECNIKINCSLSHLPSMCSSWTLPIQHAGDKPILLSFSCRCRFSLPHCSMDEWPNPIRWQIWHITSL